MPGSEDSQWDRAKVHPGEYVLGHEEAMLKVRQPKQMKVKKTKQMPRFTVDEIVQAMLTRVRHRDPRDSTR